MVDNTPSSLEQHMHQIILIAIPKNPDNFLNLMFNTVFSLYFALLYHALN